MCELAEVIAPLIHTIGLFYVILQSGTREHNNDMKKHKHSRLLP
jgi:hypothetical protein